MRPAADFWFSLAHLARLIQHASGSPDERHGQVVNEFLRLGPLGRQTALEELQVVLRELGCLQHELQEARLAASNGRPLEKEGQPEGESHRGADEPAA